MRRASDGKFIAFGPTLPHGLDVFGDPIGPYKVVPYGSNYLVAQGTTPTDKDPNPADHAILELDEARVLKVVQSDFWNPFDFVLEGTTLYVVDAARNDIGIRPHAVVRHRIPGGKSDGAHFGREEFELRLERLDAPVLARHVDEKPLLLAGLGLIDQPREHKGIEALRNTGMD